MRITTLFCATVMAFSTSAQADLTGKFEESMDSWEKHYPVLSVVRQDPCFQSLSRASIVSLEATSSKAQSATPSNVLKDTLKLYIPEVIRSPEYAQGNKTYFWVVEALEPVYRDANGLEERKLLLPITQGHELHTVHRVIQPIQ